MAKKIMLTSWYVYMAVMLHLIQQVGKCAMHLKCSIHDADRPEIPLKGKIRCREVTLFPLRHLT